MGNTISEAQKNAQAFVKPNETNNNEIPNKNPHNFTSTMGKSPPPECPMHVKVEEKKPVGCAVAGNADEINPLNMVSIND